MSPDCQGSIAIWKAELVHLVHPKITKWRNETTGHGVRGSTLKLAEHPPHIKDKPDTIYPFSIGHQGCILALAWQNGRHGGW